MQMTHEEICRHYQQAANKSKDIGILADLNSTDKASIRAILVDAGVIPPDRPKSKAERSAELKKVLPMLEGQGLSDEEIAKRAGCSVSAVQTHRRRRKAAELPTGTDQATPEAGQPDSSVYRRVETILGTLPPDADEDTRVCAFDLCMRLLRRELLLRLGVER